MSSSTETFFAIADDRDSNVSYNGTWNPVDVPNNGYNNTATSTSISGSSATFHFQGTSVSVFGPYGLVNGKGVNATYAIDGGPPTTLSRSTSNVNNHTLFQSPVLQDGSHDLTVTLTSNNTLFQLDYFKFQPSPQTVPIVTSIVDDTDSRLSYTGLWAWSSPGLFEEGMHSTSQNGSTMTFRFNGTAISVFGFHGLVPGRPPAVSSYSIDGSLPVIFTPPPISFAYGERFFEAGPLSDGTHTLVITALNVTENSSLYLDYLLLTASVPSDLPSSSNPTTSSSAPSSTGTTTRNSIKIIIPAVGGSVGVIVVLAVILLSIFLICRRRRRRSLEYRALLRREVLASPPQLPFSRVSPLSPHDPHRASNMTEPAPRHPALKPSTSQAHPSPSTPATSPDPPAASRGGPSVISPVATPRALPIPVAKVYLEQNLQDHLSTAAPPPYA